MEGKPPPESSPGPTIEYTDDVRAAVRDGDVVLCEGHGWTSYLIRWLTGSRFSHAGLAFWWNGRLMVAEATGKWGVRVWLMSACVRFYRRRVTWFQPRDEVRAQLDLDRLRRIAMDHLGSGYRTTSLLQVGWFLLWKRPRAMKDPRRRPPGREFICSELVSSVYRAAGVDLVPHVPDGYTTPADLERSPLLERRARLTQRIARGVEPKPPGT